MTRRTAYGEPIIRVNCECCGEYGDCIWLEDPNTGDGFFTCASLDCDVRISELHGGAA